MENGDAKGPQSNLPTPHSAAQTQAIALVLALGKQWALVLLEDKSLSPLSLSAGDTWGN